MLNVFKNPTSNDDFFNRTNHLYTPIDENSISQQALKDESNLHFAPTIRSQNTLSMVQSDEISILTKLYHEHPNVSAEFVNNMNKFLEVITNNYEKEFPLESLIGFLEEKDITLYFDFTYAISQKLIVFPENNKILSALCSHWIENTQNLALLNFSLIYDGLIASSHENERHTHIACKLLQYPQTVLCASYYLINCYVNNKQKFNEVIINEIKSNHNIHIRTFLLHFLTIDLKSIEIKDKIYFITNAKKLFNILSQYRINGLLLSILPNEFDASLLSNEEVISIFETLHILAIDGPKSGLTLNEHTVEIIDKLFNEILSRENDGKIFFPIFFYKPFLSLLNFYKDHVGKNLDESHQNFTQNLLNKIYDKFKLREEKLDHIDSYTPGTFIHKSRTTPNNIELHLFEDNEGKLLTIYPIIKPKNVSENNAIPPTN